MEDRSMNQKVYTIKKAVERPSNLRNSKISFGEITFSKTQVRVLEKVGEGYSNLQIAEELVVSRRTVESHLAKVRQILSDYFGYKFCDRELVIFARNMLQEYKEYIKNNIEDFSKKYLFDNFDSEAMDLTCELKMLQSQYTLASELSAEIEKVRPSLDNWMKMSNGF